MVIWDTAGQEKYHALARNYYQGASGALLVYDVTDEDSFQRAKKWYTELRREIGAEAPIILAGNKCDILNHTVQKEDADQFARSKGFEHVQTSAQNGNNVEYIFSTLAESKYINSFNTLTDLVVFFLIEMVAIKANQDAQQKPGAAVGRATKRGQLRVEGVQEFNPAGSGTVTLSRQSEARAKKEKDDGKKKGGCCGGSK